MSHVTFSPAAIADIDGIWDYTAETWGLDPEVRQNLPRFCLIGVAA